MTESQLQYKNCLSILAEKDSTISLETQKSQDLSIRLDKTENVLANIYLKFGQNIPRKIDGSLDPANLNAFILEENLQLRDQVNRLIKSFDSLNTIKQNPYYQDPNYDFNKNSKKNKNQADQQNYIFQLENNLQSEQTKNKQIQKELNAYSLRLEIIDNERLKEVKEINSKLQSAQIQSDSLIKLLSYQDTTIAELKSNQNQKEEIKLSTKDLKLKDKLRLAEDKLEASRNKLIQAQKELNSLNIKLAELDQNLMKEKEKSIDFEPKINQLQAQLSELNEQRTKENEIQNTKISELSKLNEKLEREISNSNSESASLKKQNQSLSEELEKANNNKNTKENQNQTKKIDKSEHEKIVNNLTAEITKLNEIALLNTNEINQLKFKSQEKENIILNLKSQIQELNKSSHKNPNYDTDSSVIKEQKIQELENQIFQIQSTHQNEISQLHDSLKLSSSKIQELNLIQQNLLRENEKLKSKEITVSENKMSNELSPTTQPIQVTEPIPQNNSLQGKPDILTDKDPSKVIAEKVISPTIKNNNEINDQIIVKLEKLISEIGWPGMSVRKEDGNAIVVVPQSYVFLNSTLALNEEGSKLIMRIHNILNGVKKNQIDIIAYSDPEILSEEFKLNRAKTISKLFKALGTPALNLNTGSRVYARNVDVEQFKEGIEFIIRNI